MPTPSLLADSGATSDQVALVLPNGANIQRFVSYSFPSDFLVPTDRWSFELAGTLYPPSVLGQIRGGAKVLFQINGKTQGGGYVDQVDVHNDGHQSGTVLRCSGRDSFGPVVDSGADPALLTFQPSATIEDVVRGVFEPFGFANVAVSNDANLSVMTGIRTTTRKKGRPIKSTVIARKLKPYPSETCFDFVMRFLSRAGLWCWPSADQTTVIVDVPHFDMGSMFQIARKRSFDRSNVINGSFREDASNQPSMILAAGTTQGGDIPHAGMKVIVPNELTGVDVDQAREGKVLTLLPGGLGLVSRYPSAKYFYPRDEFLGFATLFRNYPHARPWFVVDSHSKTIDELVKFAYKELSLKQQQMWTAHYTVEGHCQVHVPWAVGAMVDVDDDVGDGFHGPMWIRGRTFRKDRHGGTTTDLHLILPNTLQFSEPGAA